ncbi:MAG: anaerobic ribonucleoside-triphosphate reductase, partial [Desulfovibrio sp.]
MLASIIKRDGTEVAFDSVKILNAITKANKASGEDMSPTDLLFVTEKVCRKLEAQNLRHVEEIQDVVEETLIQYDYAKTAKAYILYRAEHTKRRNAESYLMEIYKTLTYAPAIEEDIKRENANIDGDTAMGTMLKYGSEGAKYFTDNYVLPKDASAAHINGDIHIHDKDFYMLTETCCQIDLIPLFRNGFSTGHGHLREPNSIESYSALACIAIQANQNEMHGGQSVPHFDYAMAGGVAKTFRKEYRHAFTAFVRIRTGMDAAQAEEFSQQILLPVMPAIRMADVDELGKRMEGLVAENERDLVRAAHAYAAEEALRITDRRTYQAMEAFVHNLNTMNSRAGAQVPFSSVNYGTDTSAEGRMVVRNLLLATQAGLGSGETSIFPVQIFKVKEGVNYNEGDPNYDLFKMAIKTSAMRLFPNFSFLDAPFNLQYYKPGDYNSEVAYMGCRTRVLGNVYDPDRQVTCGRGNLSFTSINLPRLGIEAKGDLDRFFQLLDDQID